MNNNNNKGEIKTEAFPKIPERPKVELSLTPLQVLTFQLLSIIDIITGQVFMDALPLIGGEAAKEELSGWMVKQGEEEGDNKFEPKKALSMYSTLTLTAFGVGQTAQQHIMKSQSDAMKGIYEVANMYESYRELLFDFRKTLKSKDLTPLEKLDALWAVVDTLYEEFREKVTRNAKNDPESLDKVIGDLNSVFISLEKLTEGAKMIKVIEPSSSSNI